MDPRLAAVVVGLLGAVALQPTLGESNAERRRSDFRYTPDPRVARIVAGGHRSSAADLLWLRALPDMSREFSDLGLKKRWLEGVFHVATELDPMFFRVYLWGSDYLALIDRDDDAATRLLERGIERNPEVAALHTKLAMEHWKRYERTRDPAERARAHERLRVAAGLPGCDALSLSMLSSLEIEGRDDWLALAHWAQIFEQGTGQVRALGERELLGTKRRIAQRAMREFEAREGRPPASPDELRDPTLIEERVIDFVLDGMEVAGPGRARYARLEELEFALAVETAEAWSRAYRDEQGRWPALEQVLHNPWGRMPPPPEGLRYEFESGRLRLR
jgi:hypothetical protein